MYANKIMNIHFNVTIGQKQMSFAKISGLEKQMEYSRTENGRNPAEISIEVKPYTEPYLLIMERGVDEDQKIEMQVGGRIDVMTISVLNANGEFVRNFGVDNAVIVKQVFSELEGMGNQIWQEQLVIAHTGLEVL